MGLSALNIDKLLVHAGFVLSPAIAYVPQIISRDILISPLISMLFIMSNILKLFHYCFRKYEDLVLAQHVFAILLHLCLIIMSRRPLGGFETKMLGSGATRLLFRSYGAKGSVIGILIMFSLSVNLLGMTYKSYEPCGILSSIFEIGINLLQLILERREAKTGGIKGEAKRSPKEVYVCWILGDIVKIWFYSGLDVPLTFMVTIAVQILIDVFLMLA
ncbi:hypothetical protein CWI42_121690 [Ordospora colligata]|uniref:Uncharacterized protein n=1 Tax=Ordospora colligata OC4 TaxID=1354746 RepID=A0A0B2UD06_9MICR|nr:uncharacterized protein M896_121690 [Ordospora colligata OC4]KHN68946.1 hypothetical protein M896_121690 [Ordospora colligata OC4]TBU13980.1 hypothetical protein CWI40_121690 [Ordospora colligata]TBU14169.1 hypothetical protein CWI41_121690 [Ordospora colligata]TBU17838.1 hypothetical protein CWI42_121690 [Ordospora colligata]